MSGLGFQDCVLRSDNRVLCWGANVYGELGDGTMVARPQPVEASIDSVVGIGAGEQRTCAVRSDGTAACWGGNSLGQLGDGTTINSPLPKTVLDLTDAEQIMSGQTHSCARHRDGGVSCWGANSAGELGTDVTPTPVPRRVVGIDATTYIAIGDGVSFALRDGALWSWGFGPMLGDGAQSRLTPGIVPSSGRVIDISAGCHYLACALLEDGSAWCWGDGGDGQLGDGLSTTSRLPQRVASSEPFVEISAGAVHACGRTRDGEVWCWGDASWNQIGDDTMIDAATPRLVALPEPIDDVEAGCGRTCASAGDRVWCWGTDESVSVGMPAAARAIHPIDVPCP